MEFTFLGDLLSEGPLNAFLVGLSLVLLVVAVVLFVLGLLGGRRSLA